MVHIAAAIEDHDRDALGLGPLGQHGADLLGSLAVAGGTFKFLVQGGSRSHGNAVHIIDDLGVNVRIAAEHIQARSLGCAGDLATHSGVALQTLRILIDFPNHLWHTS